MEWSSGACAPCWISCLCTTSSEPISRNFRDRPGRPIDRHYIEAFLAQHREKIQGAVLEIADSRYTRRFGDNRVTQPLVMHEGWIRGRYRAHLSKSVRGRLRGLLHLTQVLPFVCDVRSTIKNALKMLKLGGSLLVTVGGITQVSRDDAGPVGLLRSFTDLALRKLFEAELPPECVQVQSFGNVPVATSFLYGLGKHELTVAEPDHFDRDYPVIIGAVVTRPMA
ncbi:MAG: methyltransferase [Fibrobacteres bacterium]|nr:methyltransferase [Fibrobacterota bacterium]